MFHNIVVLLLLLNYGTGSGAGACSDAGSAVGVYPQDFLSIAQPVVST
jgi:hypothetical protein